MFVGREEELKLLGNLFLREKASLIICQGRRRIGKSTLIGEFARRSQCRYLEFAGLAPAPGMTADIQRQNFCERLSSYTGISGIHADSWSQAFEQLSAVIGTQERTVVLLDEISWMSYGEKNFAGYLKNAWDLQWSRRDNLMVVLCGSVSSWIADNILNSTGFVGRISLLLTLKELKLKDCLQFWGPRAERLSIEEFFDVLSVTGGVPRYLEGILPQIPFDENIRQLIFSPSGFLFQDFKQIFADVFGEKAVLKRRILAFLSNGARTQQEIAIALNNKANGHLSQHLSELELAGFVAKDNGLNPATGQMALKARYRICDNYTRFYLKYVAPQEEAIQKQLFSYQSLSALPEWNTIMGLQFETLVLNHITECFEDFGLGRSRILSLAPYRLTPGKDGTPGVQVDLLIQTPRTAYIVEIKRKHEIGPEIEHEVAQKISRIKLRSGVSPRTALVFLGSLSPAVYDSGFFDAIIPAETFLGKA